MTFSSQFKNFYSRKRTIKWPHGFWSTLIQVMACCRNAPSHHLYQCCLITNQILENTFPWSFNRNSNIFIHGTLRWRHNERDIIPNQQHLECLPTCLFRRRSKKISKLHVTGLCEGNSPVTGKFPAQRASDPENVSIWWRHHEIYHKKLFVKRWPFLFRPEYITQIRCHCVRTKADVNID